MAAGIIESDFDSNNSVNSSAENGSSCYLSSSAESAEEDVVYVEEVVEENGEQEIVLTPATPVTPQIQSRDKASGETKALMGELSHTAFFLTCARNLASEEVMRRSPNGKKVNLILDKVFELEEREIIKVAILLADKVGACITAGKKLKLPSVAQTHIWTSFHKLRFNPEIKQAWSTFAQDFSDGNSHLTNLTLQLLLDRMLTRMLHNRAKVKIQLVHVSSESLSTMEKNAINYMAGYVAVNLLKRFRKPTKNLLLKEKWSLFVKVLTSMRAEEQPGDPESVTEYTTLWSILIDRGGLYHINKKVYQLMEAIELVCRKYLNVKNVPLLSSGTDVRKMISDEVKQSEQVLACWETVAYHIPTKYEKYSLELLQHVTDIWIKIRCHSFAKEFTSKLVKKKTKGTRKTLKDSKL